MFVLTIPFLLTKRLLLNYTLVGVSLCVILNIILKFVFHYPRPGNDNPSFKSIVKQTTFQQSVEDDPYGFPSGHSQTAAFLATIIYHAFGLKPITIVMVIYTVFIMAQRVYSERHYVYQVIGGAATGIVVATGVYYSYQNQLVGHIMHKIDDWSRIL
jgi:membrane-associated phospholipid phosphatase